MDIVHSILIAIGHHLAGEFGVLITLIFTVFLGRRTHRVPAFQPLNLPVGDNIRLAKSNSYAGQLLRLGFKPVAKYDATMTSSASMYVDVFIARDELSVAAIVYVHGETGSSSFVEFHTDLSPHGNITTNNSRHATIFYRTPDKMVAKVPWKTTAGAVYELHRQLCSTARECGFGPAAIKPEHMRDVFIRSIRDSFDDQVKCGRLVKVSDDAYRASLKGSIIFVPLVWSKKTYGFVHDLVRPSDQTFCNRLKKRLQKVRALPEAGNSAMALATGRLIS